MKGMNFACEKWMCGKWRKEKKLLSFVECFMVQSNECSV